MSATEGKRTYPIKVLGRRIGIQSGSDEKYVHRVAAFVNDRVEKVREASRSADPVEVTILAALNIADEYFRSQDEGEDLDRRLEELCRLVEEQC